MILDDRLEFCDATSAIQAASTTALLGDVIDLGAASEDQNGGDGLYLVISVDTAFVSANNNTVAFELASDAQAAIATDGSATQHILTQALAGPANYPAGTQLKFELPPSVTYERYLGILMITGAGASGITAGKINAFLTRDVGTQKAYPDAI